MKEKIKELWRIYYLLIRKSFLVRKRHWKLILFVQILIPFFLFLLAMFTRNIPDHQSNYIWNDTISPPISLRETIDDIPPHWRKDIRLHYFPNHTLATEIMNKTVECMDPLINQFLTFATMEEAIANYNVEFWARTFVVDLTNINNINQKNLQYTLMNTMTTFYNIQPAALFENYRYEYFAEHSEYTMLQQCLERSFIKTYTSNSSKADQDFEVLIQQMPQPPHLQLYNSINYQVMIVASFAVVAFTLVLCVEIGYAAKEKFIGTNFLLSINGLSVYKNLLSWHISSVATSVIYVTLCSLTFLISFNFMYPPVTSYIDRGNLFLFWVFLMIYVSHLMAFGTHIAAYFTKPFYATMVPCLINLISFILYMSMHQEGMTWRMPYIGFFFPSVFLYRTFQEIDTYENIEIGLHFSNLFTTADENKYTAYSIGGIMILSIFGTVFHFLMAVYIYQLCPGKYGIAKNPLFLFMRFKRKIFKNPEQYDYNYHKIGLTDLENVSKDSYTPGIQIRGLKKTYVTGCYQKKYTEALKGISIDFYKGQITALLGHNGAGKSTMMNILSGLADATAGVVFINEKNAKFEKHEILKDFGLCPQENLAFPELNVFEQLQLFGMLKAGSKSKEEVDDDVDKLLDKLNLSEKRDVLPHQLSGGQRRRLCLGLALIGDASTIILDEPTSGMDPETRRNVWDLILKMRGQKTILFSTHNMEEADVLGDRIAIIHEGSLKCCDTPMALKKQYGHDHMEISFSIQPWCEIGEVRKYFDEKTKTVSVGNNKLVLSVSQEGNLPDILDKLEKDKGDLGITGMSVSLITMDQVFLRVVDEQENTPDVKIENLSAEKVTGWDLQRQWILTLFEKRLTYARKNFKSVLFMMLLPVIMVFIMALTYMRDNTEVTVEYPINLELYRNPISMYASEDQFLGKMYEKHVNSFRASARRAESGDVITELLNVAKQDYPIFATRYITSAAFNVTKDTINASAIYQRRATFSLPISINLVNNALLKYYGEDENYRIEMINRNLPSKKSTYPEEYRTINTLINIALLCIYVIIAMPMFVVQPLRENNSHFKQIQRMTGLPAITYWGVNFLFDFTLMLLSTIILITGLAILDAVFHLNYFQANELGVLTLLILLYTINVLPIIYLFSFLQKRVATVIIMLIALPIGIGLLQFLLMMFLSIAYHFPRGHLIPLYLFRITPHMNFGHGLLTLLMLAEKNSDCRYRNEHSVNGCGYPIISYLGPSRYENDPFENLPMNVMWLTFLPLLYFGLLFLVELRIVTKLITRFLAKKPSGLSRDTDELVKREKELVAREINARRYQRTRTVELEPQTDEGEDVNWSNVLRNSKDESLLLVYELSKSYGKLRAVQEVSFSVKNRECFGLLGVNGAGKSTTFKVLTGDEALETGVIYLGKANLQLNRKEYLAELGYCPQTNALISTFDVYDHLRLFAGLRGVEKPKIDAEVEKWIERLNLISCAHQASSTYCGADKRRLSTAIALIGNPSLVLLDEPTNGLDPTARRAMWKVLKACQDAGQSIILTSHSMEECEVLCDRLVIMVEGKLVCIGPSQQLKQRFGAGCNIQLKINVDRSEEDLWNIKNLVQSKLRCTLVDENLSFLSYHITDSKTTWRTMYDIMKDIKEKYECVEDFSIQSATLEELFIQFAKRANKSTDPRSEFSTVNLT